MGNVPEKTHSQDWLLQVARPADLATTSAVAMVMHFLKEGQIYLDGKRQDKRLRMHDRPCALTY